MGRQKEEKENPEFQACAETISQKQNKNKKAGILA
jgi:hypothetical protein